MNFNIVIEKDQFYIIQCPREEASVCETLGRIKEVLERDLKYAAYRGDECSRLDRGALRQQLKDIATITWTRYLEKQSQEMIIVRIFAYLFQGGWRIERNYHRIEQQVGDVPNDIMTHLFHFLPQSQLKQLYQEDLALGMHTDAAIVACAEEYGYRGNTPSEASVYLESIMSSVESLVKNQYIPSAYVIYSNKKKNTIDAEATLRKIKYGNCSEKAALTSNLSKAALICVESGKFKLFRTALFLGADIETKDSEGRTLLACAAQSGDTRMVQLLLEAGAKVDSVSNMGTTPLILAARKGHLEVVNLLLQHGAMKSLNHRNQQGVTALYAAANNNRPKIVKRLLEVSDHVGIKTNDGYTPLQAAAKKGCIESVTLLLEAAANANTVNNQGSTPLMEAISWGDETMISLLLKHGGSATINQINHNGNSALHLAIKNKLPDIVIKLLIEAGANLEVRDHKGRTPLALAAVKGYCHTHILLAKGADVNTLDNTGSTPLILALADIHHELVRLLLIYGATATLNNLNHEGQSALGWSIIRWQKESAKLLLDFGATRDILDEEEKKALDKLLKGGRNGS